MRTASPLRTPLASGWLLLHRQAGLAPGVGTAIDVEQPAPARSSGVFAGQRTALPHLADEEQVLILGQLILTQKDAVQGDQHGAGSVSLAVFAGLAHVDDRG